MQEQIINLLKDGHSKKSISEQLGIGYSTVRKYSKGVRSKSKSSIHKCIDCGIDRPELFYGNMKHRCKQCHNRKGYESQKKKIIKYTLSRGPIACCICGYNKTFAALDWHHRDPKEKDPLWNKGWNYDRLKIELDKCDLVCANCHREIHAGIVGSPTPTRTGT